MSSTLEKNWNVFGSAKDLSDVKSIILKKRGFNSPEKAKAFLADENPLTFLRDFPGEFKSSLKKAASFIESAIESSLPIIIHGDYDADGVCATSVLYNYLKYERDYDKTFYFIPNRFDHGYGLSKSSINESIERFREQIPEAKEILFITVDSGITSIEEVSYIKKLGHKIIITDHHQKPSKLPGADVIVWSDEIVGASIAWVLAKVLGSSDDASIAFPALATVTDVQPVLGMNRALIKRGLKRLNTSPPSGIKELIQISGITGKEISAYELGWVLGPRINATGRLTDASQAVNLFTTKEPRIAYEAAKHLNSVNYERQEETSRMFEMVEEYTAPPKFIFAVREDFHEGIIGLIAARLVRKYNRPAIVISQEGEFGKGSVRSIEGINIIEILREHEDLFVNLGGHPLAAGFTLPLKNIKTLEDSLSAVFDKRFSDEIFIPSLDIDVQIDLTLVDWDLLEFVEMLKPFGVGNPSPRFLTENLTITNIDYVGKEKNHTVLKLYDGNSYQKAIYFSSREYFRNISLGDSIDIVYTIKENNFMGNKNIDLIIQDFRPVL